MTTLDVLIDLTDAGLDLEPEELEAYTLRLAKELKDGLAEDAVLARSSELVEGSKAGEAGFDLGILKAEVNLKNFKSLMDWLGDRIYGRTIKIVDGDKVLEYRTSQQLEEQLKALERITELRIRVIKSEAGKD
jgi:coenzyme F420-reducing hydrogenase delta subunit